MPPNLYTLHKSFKPIPMKFSFTDYKEITFCGRFEIFNFIGSINYIFVMDKMVRKNSYHSFNMHKW